MKTKGCIKIPESIRDESSGTTVKIDPNGLMRVTLYNNDTKYNSSNPLPVSITPLNDTVYSTVVTVNQSITLLPSATLNNRKAVSIKNYTSTTFYIGGINVSHSNGYPIEENESIDIDVGTTSKIYAITETGTAYARILEFS